MNDQKKSEKPAGVAAIISNHTLNPWEFGLQPHEDGTPVVFVIPGGSRRAGAGQGQIPGRTNATAEELAILRGNKTFAKLVADEMLSVSAPI